MYRLLEPVQQFGLGRSVKISYTLSRNGIKRLNMIMPHMKSNSIHSVVEAALLSERHNRKITIAYLLARIGGNRLYRRKTTW